jgi:beta-phosphoglucomutase-like phosphatase (HAD superfamily)
MNPENQENPPTNDIPPLLAVIFDVDGTLAETELNGHRVAFNRAFEEFNIDWHWTPEVYGELLKKAAGGKERIRYYAETHAPELLGRIDLNTWIARLHQLKSEIYSALVLSGAIPLRPGVARLINELRYAGVRLAIATTTTPSSLQSLIMANFNYDMMSIFEVIGAGDLVINKKPAPDIYQWVLRQMKLPPESCLVVEDSLLGFKAARATGLPTLITVSTYASDYVFDGAVSVISDLGEAAAPARHIAGLPLAGPYVDLAQLRAWHHQYLQATRPKEAHPG